MQPETALLKAYLPGKKPPPPTGTGSPRFNDHNVRHHHQHSNSPPPPDTHHHRRAASSVSGLAPAALCPRPPPLPPRPPRPRSSSTSAVGETTTVLVGRHQRPFLVNRQLLCGASPFFREQLQRVRPAAAAAAAAPSSSCGPRSLPSSSSQYTDRPVTLWLPGESATMFGLFVEWLRAPGSFRSHLDDAGGDGTAAAAQRLHWALVRLHMFAAHLGLPALQDLAMDAVQDLYLRRDWDMAPGVVAYLYTQCDARHAARLRRWAVAMVAFSLAVAGDAASDRRDTMTRDDTGSSERRPRAGPAPPASARASSADPPARHRLHGIIAALPELAADYAAHVRSMRAARLDMRWKNPQLRIPANALRNDDRAFGFRECSFHSHRAAVGQGPCPHAASGLRAADTGSMLDLEPCSPEVHEDDDDDDDDIRQWEKEWADEFG